VPGHDVPNPDAPGALLATVGVGALTLGLVQGEHWGWASAETIAALAVAVVSLGAFVLHTLHARNPLIEPGLFRTRAFRGASVAMVLFSMGFGAMLLSVVLWMQDGWGWSALRTGLAIAPGPLMVPLFGLLVSGRLIARFGPGPVAGAGTTLFGLGLAWNALAIGVEPHYVRDALPGMLLTGVGVGLTLPTLMATAAGSLPSQSFATGSAVVNTLRQVGMAVGVAVLVALLGAAPQLADFQTGWWVFAGVSFAAAAAAILLLGHRRPALAPAPAGATG
jgi:hypothetical protein